MISNTLYFPALLDTILKISPLSKNNIGLIYSLISSQNVTSLTKSKQQWESELDLLFLEETWQDIINKIHSTSFFFFFFPGLSVTQITHDSAYV